MLLWGLAVLDGVLTHAVSRRSQMIYFVFAVSVLAQSVQNGALLELTGDAAKIEFGGALTLIHNSTEDELVCSGKIRASDVVIEGTTTTVAEMVAEHASMKADIAALKQFVGMMPPPSAPPPSSPSPWAPAQPGACRDGTGTLGNGLISRYSATLEGCRAKCISLDNLCDAYDFNANAGWCGVWGPSVGAVADAQWSYNSYSSHGGGRVCRGVLASGSDNICYLRAANANC